MSGGKYCGIEKRVGSKKLGEIALFFLFFIFFVFAAEKNLLLDFLPRD